MSIHCYLPPRAPDPPLQTRVHPSEQLEDPPRERSEWSKQVCSPTYLSCMMCTKKYDNNRFQLNCCKKHTCLECISTWFVHYGKKCPFCNIVKSENDPDIDRLINFLAENPKQLEVLSNTFPSRRINTNPLLPQTSGTTTDPVDLANINLHSSALSNAQLKRQVCQVFLFGLLLCLFLGSFFTALIVTCYYYCRY